MATFNRTVSPVPPQGRLPTRAAPYRQPDGTVFVEAVSVVSVRQSGRIPILERWHDIRRGNVA